MNTKNILSTFQSFSIISAISVALILIAGTAHAATVNIQLDPGMTNSDVSALQTFLAKDSAIYPEGLVTGFFGPMTVAAVKRYQEQNGISAVGRVGPSTLASINGTGGIGGTDDVRASITTATNVSTTANDATVGWTSNEPVFGSVMYATQWPFVYATAPSVKSTSGFSTSQLVSLKGLQSNTTYYYVLESTDVAGNLNWTIGNTFKTQ